MPIYEFYCQDCNTIYQFFCLSVNTDKIPGCPKCDNPKLERTVSIFSALSGELTDDEGEDGMPPIDEAKMERAMAMMAGESEKLDEDNPKQAADFMRRLSKEAGIKLGPKMEEALNRLEKGEDPDKIEEDMGDALDDDELFVLESQKKRLGKKAAPKRDDTIYDL